MKPTDNDEASSPNRREFLQQNAGIAAASIAAGAATPAIQDTPQNNELFQPESYWADRMKQPDDGKDYGWFVDTRRCFGCHACEVSCKSENDVPLGNYIRQTFFHDEGQYPKVARLFLPMSCQHCEDAPCVKACPCGALHKKSGGTVAVDYDQCCGHGTCVDVCPYGAIYLDPVAKQAVKCHNCYHRTEHDMEPACVTTCPSKALFFGDINDENSSVSKAMKEAKAVYGLVQLRGEKGTKPRMWFTGDAAPKIEPRLPAEGESYHPDAYNIYNWKGDPPTNSAESESPSEPSDES